MSTPPTRRAGWRTFECDGGGEDHPNTVVRWQEATRDCHSPSGTDCPVCGWFTHPEVLGEVDPTLPLDQSGNLLLPMEERIRPLPL